MSRSELAFKSGVARLRRIHPSPDGLPIATTKGRAASHDVLNWSWFDFCPLRCRQQMGVMSCFRCLIGLADHNRAARIAVRPRRDPQAHHLIGSHDLPEIELTFHRFHLIPNRHLAGAMLPVSNPQAFSTSARWSSSLTTRYPGNRCERPPASRPPMALGWPVSEKGPLPWRPI